MLLPKAASVTGKCNSVSTYAILVFGLSKKFLGELRTRTGVLLSSEKKNSIGFCVKENQFLFNGQSDAKLKLAFHRQLLVRTSLMASLGRYPHFSVQEGPFMVPGISRPR